MASYLVPLIMDAAKKKLQWASPAAFCAAPNQSRKNQVPRRISATHNPAFPGCISFPGFKRFPSRSVPGFEKKRRGLFDGGR